MIFLGVPKNRNSFSELLSTLVSSTRQEKESKRGHLRLRNGFPQQKTTEKSEKVSKCIKLKKTLR